MPGRLNDSPEHLISEPLSLYRGFCYRNTSLPSAVERALLWPGNNENARIAFDKFDIRCMYTRLDCNIMCECCERLMNYELKRLICEVRADVDVWKNFIHEDQVLDVIRESVARCVGTSLLAVPQPDHSQTFNVSAGRPVPPWIGQMLELRPLAAGGEE